MGSESDGSESFYLPDKVDHENITKTLSEYWGVRLIRDEVSSHHYRFKVKNGNKRENRAYKYLYHRISTFADIKLS